MKRPINPMVRAPMSSYIPGPRQLRARREILPALVILAIFFIISGNFSCLTDQADAADSSSPAWIDSVSESKNEGTAASGSSTLASPIVALTETERAWLREHPVITVVQDQDWPPIEYVDDQGEQVGMSNDYLKLVEERLGLKFERVRARSWRESYARLKRWEIDMTTCVTVTPERLEFWVFTKPYMKIPIVIFAQADVTFISHMRELAGKRVAVVDGYAVCEWISRDFPDIQLVKVKSVKEGLALLQHRDVFAYIDNMLVVSYYLAKREVTSVKIAGETPYVNAQSMAVRKDWPILAGILQKALDSISQGERDVIYQKWVPVIYEHGFKYTLLWRALAIFTLILLFLLFWNRRLSREVRYRKKAEIALIESEKRMRNILNNVGAYVYMKDTRYRYTYVNNKVCELFGRQEQDILGKGDEAFFSGASVEAILRSDRLVIEKGETVNLEEKGLVASDKSPRTYWSIKIPLRDNSGKIYAMCGISTDITDRKRSEEEREKLQAQLSQAQKIESVGRLAGGVAHDFNNMLSIIIGYTDMILDYVDPDQPLHASLQEIRKAAERSADLTRQLLAFARQQTVAPKALALNETVGGMLKMLRRLIGEDISLLWLPGEDEWQVKIDPSQIDQIMANLCVNARDAIAGVGKLTIETDNVVLDEAYCEARADFVPGEYVRLAVSDSGSGMDKETMERLFEPFFTTKERGKGTGLGLATVYGIVKQNNGFINVYSEPGKGTTFRIYLPRHIGGVDETEKKMTAEFPRSQGETVLLVEDEPSIITMAKLMLENLGYRVLATSAPGEATRLATEYTGEIHLLLTDVVMPEMNGRDLADRLRALYPAIKTLFMSGYTTNVIAHHGILEEGVHFIQKPFSIKDLALKVRETLG